MTPNFHDFLNLPVKYNPDKYVYPLISSSYANTKIQGNVQSSSNHKNYNSATVKPTVSPTYYSTKSVYYQPKETTASTTTTQRTTTTTKTTTTQTPPTTKVNLLNSPMNHPSYYTTEPDYAYNDYEYFTTKAPVKAPPPIKEKTTQRPYSIFDELFGDYEEPKPALKPPSLFSNLPSMGFSDKVKPEDVKEKNDTKPGLTNMITQNSHGVPNNGDKDDYEYDDYEETAENVTKSQIVTPEPTKNIVITTQKTASFSNFHQNYKPVNEVKESSYNVYPQNDTKSTEKPYISITSSENYEDLDDEEEITKSSTKIISITETPPAMRVTSLPLGENHPTARLPIISLTNGNLKEQLMNEMVDMPTKIPEKDIKPSASTNIHVAPDQDTVSFVVSNKQNENQKETFVSNSFRPLYTQNQPQQQPALDQNGKIKETITFTGTGQTNSNYSWTVPQKHDYPNFESMPASVYNQEIQSNYSWTIPETSSKLPIKFSQTNSVYNSAPEYNLQHVSSGYSVGQSGSGYAQGSVFNVGTNYGTKYKIPQGSNYQYAQVGTNYNLTVYPEGGASVNIQPLRGTEASLSIGSPTNEIKTKPGQVVDEKLDLKDPEIVKNKPSNKIVFPDDKPTTYAPNPNREILSLYSKPMLHPLPSDLTPPSEKEVKPPIRNNVRPPWDPRPGHFYAGRPEYARPPRPHKPEIYKRVDGLPNILPQFRPNAKVGTSAYHHDIPINGYMQRQPLLERPSNRPIGFFEKLLPPPPPPKRILELRKPVTLSQHLMQAEIKERHPIKESKIEKATENFKEQQFSGFPPQIPPKVPIANRRNGEDDTEISTLQMLHAKQSDKVNTIKPNMPPPFKINYKETTDKPVYVVYPVNSSPLKLDVLDTDNKETVVIGTRSEPPLPPSKINQEFPTYTEQKPILKPKDSPILKPHSKPNFPVKTEFPYPIEKPDPTVLNNPETASKESEEIKYPDPYQSNNQWTTLETESRIINGNKINLAEPISATLKTYTPSPIAIAYTPTESSDEKYSMPNYASSVISEIRNTDKSHQHGIVGNQGSEFTVSAVMHTHQNMMLGNTVRKGSVTSEKLENHKLEEVQYPAKLDFQAPFQASVNIGSSNNGWSVVRDKSKENIDRKDDGEMTTLIPETSTFDIENFKPQMFSGFKPIYEFPEEKETSETNGEK